MFEKFADFSGTYKMMSATGFEELIKMVGGDLDKLNAMMNPKARMVLEQCGLNMTCKVIGSGVSMNMSYQFGEEFEFIDPLLPEEPAKVG